MLREESSTGRLKISTLDLDKSVGMCDEKILSMYWSQLQKLSGRFNEKIVWGLSPYTKQPPEDVIFYVHSYPLYIGGLVRVENAFNMTVKNGIKLDKDNLLRLCDYLVSAKLELRGQTHEIVCGILMMDKTKRKSVEIPQIWIREEDTAITEEALDWFCHHFILNELDPVVVSRQKLYTESSIISCGIYFKGE